jgi:hypothetical protein
MDAEDMGMGNGSTQKRTADRNDGFEKLPTWAQAFVLILLLAASSVVTGCAGLVSAGPNNNHPPVSSFTLNPGSVDFGSVAIGNKVPQQVAVVNTGNTSIQITALTVSAPVFSVSGATLPLSLGVGQGANFSVWFTGGTPGKATGTLTAQGTSGTNPAVVSLSGTVVNFAASPSSLSFSGVKAGTSLAQNLTISNTSTADVTISQINSNAKDVTVSGITLPITLSANQSATEVVQFKPMTGEKVTGNITIVDSQGASLTVGVSAIGTQGILTVTPANIAFGSVVDGITNTQSVQITNTGNDTLTISQATVTGSNFFSTNGLAVPMILAAGQSTNFNVLFAPQLSGSISGGLRLDSDGTNPSTTLALSGTGVNPTHTLSVSQSSIDFGTVLVGNITSQTLTMTNTGNSNVTISQIAGSGGEFALAGGATPVMLTPAQSTSVTVNFDPTMAGIVTGSVAVTSDANGSPLSVSLSGKGSMLSTHTVSLTWGASPSVVTGYHIYRSTTDGAGYAPVDTSLISTLDYTDSTVFTGTTYYYVATAVDDVGSESVYSDQASAVIP